MFAYCGNNPVFREDSNGDLWNVVFGAALGGIIAGVSKAIECAKRGDSVEQIVGQALVSAACGAVGGALAATGIGLGGQILIGASLGAAESAVTQTISTGTVDMGTLALDTISGAVGGAAGGAGASHGSKFMAHHREQFVKNIGLHGFDKALSKFAKQTWKWTKSNLLEATASGVIKAALGNKLSTFLINVTEEEFGRLIQ